MSEWDDRLQVASFGGIEFEVVTSNARLERRVVEHEYAYKDGADLEDTGRTARPSRYSAIFHGDGYLDKLVEFQRLVDAGETRTLQDPLLGAWEAKAISLSIDHDQARRDGAAVELEFKEDGTNTMIPAVAAIGEAEQELSEGLTDLETSYDDLGEDVSEVGDLQTNAAGYQTALQDATDQRTQRYEELSAYSKAAVTALDAATSTDLETWPVIRDIRTIQHAARKMREAYDADNPSIEDRDISVAMPASALSAMLYGDPTREDEILRLNRIRNPFLIPAGSRLKVHGS